MVQIFCGIYLFYAIGVLFWVSSQSRRSALRHLSMSLKDLRATERFGNPPIVVEFTASQPSRPAPSTIQGSIVLSVDEFRNLVRWTPPGSILVFKEGIDGRHLDPDVENALVELEIDSVYWIDSHEQDLERGKCA